MRTNPSSIAACLLEDDDTFDPDDLKQRILAHANEESKAEANAKAKRRCCVCGEPLIVGHWSRVYEFLDLTTVSEDGSEPFRQDGDTDSDDLEIVCSSPSQCVHGTDHLTSEDKSMFHDEFWDAA